MDMSGKASQQQEGAQGSQEQFESYIVPMQIELFRKLFSDPNVKMESVYPETVQKHTVLEGTKGKPGMSERWVFTDGTYVERTMTKQKSAQSKWKMSFKITKATHPALRELVG